MPGIPDVIDCEQAGERPRGNLDRYWNRQQTDRNQNVLRLVGLQTVPL